MWWLPGFLLLARTLPMRLPLLPGFLPFDSRPSLQPLALVASPKLGLRQDICSPSYGQKKGRESNWQFDSRPLKVENRPFPDIRFECATWRWKDLDEGYNFCLDLVAIGLYSRESQEFVRFGYSLHGKLQRILYGGRWWLPPSSGRVESCVSKCPWLVPTPKGVLNAKLTSRGWFLDADSHKVS
jgi:hypothetical protein